jgi:hypothetical protein
MIEYPRNKTPLAEYSLLETKGEHIKEKNMSGDSTVAANPSDLYAGGGSMISTASNISKVGPSIDKAMSTLQGGISGAPLGAFPTAVDVLHGRIQISLQCAEDNLKTLGSNLHTLADNFQTLDAQLAATLNAIAQEGDQAYAGYEVQTAPQKKTKSGGFSWGKFFAGAGITIAGGLAVVGGGIGEIPSGGLDTPLTVAGGVGVTDGIADLTGAFVADTVASGAEIDASTALSADSIAAAESTAAGATLSEADIDAIVGRESSGLDAELEQYFANLDSQTLQGAQ